MNRLHRRLLRSYGARPVHLLAMAGCLALAAYAALQLLAGRTLAVAAWFVGAALVHDLVLVPLYSTADLTARRTLGRGHTGTTPYLNHLRVPVYLSGLLLLVWYPLILRRSQPYRGDTALSEDVFLTHWLLITAALFAASAAHLALRGLLQRLRRPPRPPAGDTAKRPAPPPGGAS
ncbi:hypothetical protein [Actinacidiphila paucisporea]|uniref:Uncharacterized protein n=1 Tax=Actinacidiphila paucisporea TaxID=310782 RepID=A0A1M7H9B7_9ACTN|nr:hypothetical protein [Actinacidiphila paucisporea]SHM24999.1 hypothetical protein SAMN05216499_109198 [Actinacidiphila paucisporea]